MNRQLACIRCLVLFCYCSLRSAQKGGDSRDAESVFPRPAEAGSRSGGGGSDAPGGRGAVPCGHGHHRVLASARTRTGRRAAEAVERRPPFRRIARPVFRIGRALRLLSAGVALHTGPSRRGGASGKSLRGIHVPCSFRPSPLPFHIVLRWGTSRKIKKAPAFTAIARRLDAGRGACENARRGGCAPCPNP